MAPGPKFRTGEGSAASTQGGFEPGDEAAINAMLDVTQANIDQLRKCANIARCSAEELCDAKTEGAAWNYRIVRVTTETGGKTYVGYGLYIVHYTDNGNPHSRTAEPASFACAEDEGPQGVYRSMVMALADAMLRPVLDDADIGAKADDPFQAFNEWNGEEDRRDYRDLSRS